MTGSEHFKFQPSPLDKKVRDALIRIGGAIPTAADEVKGAEQLQDAGERVELPPGLRDPEEVLRGEFNPSTTSAPTSKPEVEGELENLARAARDGKDIPTDIEERMKSDRDAAEKRFDDEKD